MSPEVTVKPTRLFNKTEQSVLDALRQLPSGYVVKDHPEQLNFDMDNVTYSYEPDFVIADPEGRRLIIEVKSNQSLSLANMATLAAISRHATHQDMSFLVLVADASPTRVANQTLSQFDNLHISYINRPSDAIPAIRAALRQDSDLP